MHQVFQQIPLCVSGHRFIGPPHTFRKCPPPLPSLLLSPFPFTTSFRPTFFSVLPPLTPRPQDDQIADATTWVTPRTLLSILRLSQAHVCWAVLELAFCCVAAGRRNGLSFIDGWLITPLHDSVE